MRSLADTSGRGLGWRLLERLVSGHAVNAAIENDRVSGAAFFLGAVACFSCVTRCLGRQRDDQDEDEEEDDAGQDEEQQQASIPEPSRRLAGISPPSSITLPSRQNAVPAPVMPSPTEVWPLPDVNDHDGASTLPFFQAFRRTANTLPTGPVVTNVSPSLSSSAATTIAALDDSTRQTSAVVARGEGVDLRMSPLLSSTGGSPALSGFTSDADTSFSTGTMTNEDDEEIQQQQQQQEEVGDNNGSSSTGTPSAGHPFSHCYFSPIRAAARAHHRSLKLQTPCSTSSRVEALRLSLGLARIELLVNPELAVDNHGSSSSLSFSSSSSSSSLNAANIRFLKRMNPLHLNSSNVSNHETSSSTSSSSSAYSATLSISRVAPSSPAARSSSPLALPPPHAPAPLAPFAAVGYPPLVFDQGIFAPPARTNAHGAFNPLLPHCNINWNANTDMGAGWNTVVSSPPAITSSDDTLAPFVQAGPPLLPSNWNINLHNGMGAGRYGVVDTPPGHPSLPDNDLPPSILQGVLRDSLPPSTTKAYLNTRAARTIYQASAVTATAAANAAAAAAAAAAALLDENNENVNGGPFIPSFMMTDADSVVRPPSPLYVLLAAPVAHGPLPANGFGNNQVGLVTGAGEISSAYDEAAAAAAAAVAPATREATASELAAAAAAAVAEAEENFKFYLGQKQLLFELLDKTPITSLPACHRHSRLHPIKMNVLPSTPPSLAPGAAGQVFANGTLLHLSHEQLWLATLHHMFAYEDHVASTADFRYHHELGKGNFAVVLEVGSEEDYNGEFAAKVIHLTAGDLASFSERLKIAAASVKEVMMLKECLGMEGVVQIKGVALYKGNFVIILALAQRGTLVDFLKAQERRFVSEFVCRWICLQLIRGVEALNKRGIIHGDIKLENVLVRESGAVELTDFNVSEKGGLFGQMGTPGYWAPEVHWNEYHDYRADLYSVSRVILHLACGDRSLFYASWEVIAKKLNEHGWSQGGIDTLSTLMATDPKLRPLAYEIEERWQ